MHISNFNVFIILFFPLRMQSRCVGREVAAATKTNMAAERTGCVFHTSDGTCCECYNWEYKRSNDWWKEEVTPAEELQGSEEADLWTCVSPVTIRVREPHWQGWINKCAKYWQLNEGRDHTGHMLLFGEFNWNSDFKYAPTKRNKKVSVSKSSFR